MCREQRSRQRGRQWRPPQPLVVPTPPKECRALQRPSLMKKSPDSPTLTGRLAVTPMVRPKLTGCAPNKTCAPGVRLGFKPGHTAEYALRPNEIRSRVRVTTIES